MDALSDFLSMYRPVSDLERIPPALMERVDILSCLKHRDDRQVLLLQDRLNGARLIMKIAPLAQKALLLREEAMLRRLHDEAFPHPVICLEYGANAFLLREYIPGRSFSELVEDEGPLTEAQAVALALKVCKVVGRLHSFTPPVIHRDIKPQNLILSPDGSVHLVDLDAVEDVRPEKTTDTVVMGTIGTAAPEQFGFRRCDERTDVYAIGMLLVYLLSGENARPALKDVAVSKPLRRVIDISLQFDPRKRFGSVSRLAERLSPPGGRSRKRLAWGSCILLAIVMAAALFFGAPHFSGFSGFFESTNAFAAEPAYAFKSPLIEQAVRLQLNRPRGRITDRDLRVITELFLCGETPFSRWEDLNSRGRTITIGGAPADGGAVLGDASDLMAMPNLRRLSLYRLSIQDLSLLSGLPLTHLGLGGNRIRDLAPLSDCKLLQALDVSDNPIQNLDALSGCPLLTALDISATGLVRLQPLERMNLKSLKLYDLPGGADYAVLRQLDGLEAFGANKLPSDAVAAVSGMTRLRQLSLPDCGLDNIHTFTNLLQLEQLDLGENEIASLDGVEKLISLKALDVDANRLSDLNPLSGHRGLQTLSVADNPLEDVTAVSSMPALATVFISEDLRARFDALPGGHSFSICRIG